MFTGGGDNPINAYLHGAILPSIKLETDNGEITKTEKGWLYRAGVGDSTTFTITGKTPKGTVVKSTINFIIKNIPTPQGQIRQKNVISLPLTSLIYQSINVGIPNFEFPVSFEVKSFKLKLPKTYSITIHGNTLKQAQTYKDKAKSGDHIIIYDIVASSADIENMKNIDPILIKVL